jgi:hypothetical protein
MNATSQPQANCYSDRVRETNLMTRALKRSSHVAAPLLASAALAVLAGCRPEQPKRCVDENNHVVDPSFCQSKPNPNQPGYQPGIAYWPYHYYYGGNGGFIPGSVVSGGSVTPAPGVSYSTTTRGGFGSSFGGGDGSGGHGGGGE